MNRDIIDALLTGMLQTGDGVSDLLFLAGKPPLVERHGRLHDFSNRHRRDDVGAD